MSRKVIYPAAPPVTVLLDPADDAAVTRAELAAHDPSACRITVHPTPAASDAALVLDILAALGKLTMSLGIIPAAAAREGVVWPLEQFTVFDDSRIHVELLAAKVTVTAPGELDIYLRAFARLTELAVYGADARALIVKAIDALR